MTTDLVISPELSLPIDFVTKTCAILDVEPVCTTCHHARERSRARALEAAA